jgi:hypothetical protein
MLKLAVCFLSVFSLVLQAPLIPLPENEIKPCHELKMSLPPTVLARIYSHPDLTIVSGYIKDRPVLEELLESAQDVTIFCPNGKYHSNLYKITVSTLMIQSRPLKMKSPISSCII